MKKFIVQQYYKKERKCFTQINDYIYIYICKTYLSTYWVYICELCVLGLGIWLNFLESPWGLQPAWFARDPVQTQEVALAMGFWTQGDLRALGILEALGFEAFSLRGFRTLKV